MKLAWELKRTEQDILDMPPDEFSRWVAFFMLVDEHDAKANKSKQTTPRRPRRGK